MAAIPPKIYCAVKYLSNSAMRLFTKLPLTVRKSPVLLELRSQTVIPKERNFTIPQYLSNRVLFEIS
ncbi:hypothetical protein D3C85_1515620 [compost metagenome]